MGKTRGIYRRGRIAYVRFLDEEGNIVRESTGQSDTDVAKAILRKRQSQVAERKYQLVQRFERITFGKLKSDWWDRHGKKSRSKWEYLLPRFDQFNEVKARQITPDVVEDFLDELEEKGLSPSSINHHRSIFSSIFSVAVKREWYDKNPVAAVPQRREPPPRNRFLHPEQLQRFFAVCRKEGDAELEAFVTLAATTGARKGEILPRRWSDFHLDGAAPYMVIPMTKNNHPKILPLPDLAVDRLRQLPSFGRREYLFPAQPNPKYHDVANFKKPYRWDFGKRFRRICRLAGLTNVRIHDLRHFAASMLAANDVADDTIRRLTGHRSRELDRYIHFSRRFKKRTVDLIAQGLADTGTDTVG